MFEDPNIYIGLRLKGRYLVEAHIGSGLSAHAFKAYDTLLHGRVVVKIIKTVIAGVHVDIGESWKTESLKAMQVRGHPHIASILDLGEEDYEIDGGTATLHYIVIEYIEGKTLRELAHDKIPIEPRSLFKITHQVLSTLDFLQARKLSHDDLHGGNIMVSHIDADKPFIKIIDFGMASNILTPETKGNDVRVALNQLVHLCGNTIEVTADQESCSLLEGFAALLKKAQNFIPTKRMRIIDLLGEIEIYQQKLSSIALTSISTSPVDDSPRHRINIERRTPVIGRKNELNRLYGIISSAFLSKRGKVVFISGEAGIGKTRLVDEALGLVSEEKARHLFLYSACRETPSLPYAPIMEAVSRFLDEIPGDGLNEKLEVVLGPDHQLVQTMANILDEYLSIAEGITPGEGSMSESANTTYILTRFMVQAALNIPVVLFIDDLHWADKSTIDFIGFLAHRINEIPIVIIVTYRPEEISAPTPGSIDPFREFRSKIENCKSARAIELNDLERDDADEILAYIYAFTKPQDFVRLSDSVSEMAGGNPFFVFEITRLMEDEGILKEKGGNLWVLKEDLSDFSVPYTINSLIQRRTDRLSLNDILFLRSAAIQGDIFEIGLLGKMFTPPESNITEILDSVLNRYGLIQPLEPGRRYAFCHHQFRLTLLRNMDPDDLARGHSEAARLLHESARENITPVPHHKIAHHLAQAGEKNKAAGHYYEAGSLALKAEQFHLAIDHLANAADLLDPLELENELGIKVTIDLIEAAKPLGEHKVHKQAFHQLQAIAGHTGRVNLELKSMLEECIYFRMTSDFERSLKITTLLLRKARDNGNEKIEAAALKEAGTNCYLTGRMKEAEDFFHRSAGIFATTVDRSQLARVYNNLGLVCRSTMRQGEMIQFFNRSLGIFRDASDLIGQRFPLGNLGIVYFEQGEYERAFECFNALKDSLGGRADLMMEAKVDFTLGEIYLEIGLLDRARTSCENSLSTFVTIGNRQGECEVLGVLGSIHLSLENIQIAREYFERSIEVRRAIGNTVGLLQSRITLARITNMEGRHDEALKLSQEVLKNVRARKNRGIELECLTEILIAKSQINSAKEALYILGPDENPEELKLDSPSLISFAFKVGELAFQAGDENKALKYIALSGRMVEDILKKITEPEWRDAYKKKRRHILETYHRLKPAIADSSKPFIVPPILKDDISDPGVTGISHI
jgi:tetratricopeptide (TPR) repeat protein/tRNA A-37 threonylcarbamoyl transferase component Bud32